MSLGQSSGAAAAPETGSIGYPKFPGSTDSVVQAIPSELNRLSVCANSAASHMIALNEFGSLANVANAIGDGQQPNPDLLRFGFAADSPTRAPGVVFNQAWIRAQVPVIKELAAEGQRQVAILTNNQCPDVGGLVELGISHANISKAQTQKIASYHYQVIGEVLSALQEQNPERAQHLEGLLKEGKLSLLVSPDTNELNVNLKKDGKVRAVLPDRRSQNTDPTRTAMDVVNVLAAVEVAETSIHDTEADIRAIQAKGTEIFTAVATRWQNDQQRYNQLANQLRSLK